MSSPTICRLCVKACTHFKNLYNATGQRTELYKMTRAYFHPKIVDMEEAKHLTALCLECFRHIYEFHSFQTSVIVAQLKLIEDDSTLTMKWEEDEDEDDDSVMDDLSANIIPPKVEHEKFIDEPEERTPQADSISDVRADEGNGAVLQAEIGKDSNVSRSSKILNVTTRMGDIDNLVGCPTQASSVDSDVVALTEDSVAIAQQSSKDPDEASIQLALETEDNETMKDLKADTEATNKKTNDVFKANKASNKSDRLAPINGKILSKNDSAKNEPRNRFQSKLCSRSYALKSKSLKMHRNRRHMESRQTGFGKSECQSVAAEQFDTEAEDISLGDGNVRSKNHTTPNGHVVSSKIANPKTRRHLDTMLPKNNSAKNEPRKRFQCNLCSRSYGLKSTLKVHINRRHMESRQPGIRKSGRRSVAATQFDSDAVDISQAEGNVLAETHKITNQKSRRPSVATPITAESEARAGKLSAANRWRYKLCDETTPTYNCKICGNSYLHKTSLEYHMKKLHRVGRDLAHNFEIDYDDKTKMFNCKLCDKSYMARKHWKTLNRNRAINESKKTNHKKFSHKSSTLCASSSLAQRLIIKHMERMHPEARTLTTNCDTSPSQLGRHDGVEIKNS